MQFRLRTLLIDLALGPPMLALCVASIMAIIAGGAPFSNCESCCYECGMKRHTKENWGRVTKDEIMETEASRWAQPLLASGHAHVWEATTVHKRSTWFGIAPIACGGFPEGALAAWQLARCGDQASAEQFYREYQDILTGKSSKSLVAHRKEVVDAIDAADQTNRKSNSN